MGYMKFPPLVGPNRNGPYHLMNQPKIPDFWVEWKALSTFSFPPPLFEESYFV